jgi:hypothetical protein
MKRIFKYSLTWVLAVLTVFSLLPQTAMANALELELDGDHYHITGFEGGGAYTIPAYVSGRPVTEILDRAFAGCTELTSVSFPDTLKSIGDYAFSGCTALTQADINLMPYIDYTIFEGCTSLQEFKANSANSDLTCRDGVLYSKEYPFIKLYPKGRTGSFTIPDGITLISEYAFSDSRGLTDVTIPDETISICDKAFSGCQNLSFAFFKGDAPGMGEGVFDGCKPGFVVKYISGKRGFSNPWNGVPTEAVPESVKPSANLAGITLSAGKLSPAFDASVLKYTVKLGENDKSVKVTPVKAYGGASVKIDGKKAASKTVSVANGKSTTMKIQVTCGSSKKTYVLTIKRPKAKNSLLASLKASSGVFSPAFSPAVTAYTLTLPKGKKKVTITAKAASPLAKVTPAKKTYTLKAGKTLTVTVKVKPQSGAARTYKIKIAQAKE